MAINIPETDQKRVIIVGAGFGGLTIARKLAKSNYQVLLLDRNNFHQFQPLFYQVAMAGLEPSSISFPLRKIFQNNENVFIRMAEFESVVPGENLIHTSLGSISYDFLVIATGVDTNFYGNESIQENAFTLKSVAEALYLRNAVLKDYESALAEADYAERQSYIDIAIVGGGPTGVELAGSLAEMKKYILPKDYREINPHEVDIYLIQSAPCLLKGMSSEASEKALKFLETLGVKVRLNTRAVAFEDNVLILDDETRIPCRKVIWAAGITGVKIPGLSEESKANGNRIGVDLQSRVKGHSNIFAIGDIALMQEEGFEYGHPQMAQGAIQQAKLLARNLMAAEKGKAWKDFSYRELGSLATVGRNKAVADLPGFKFQGFFAWVLWLIVHLKSILGVRNKIIVLFNWIWNYLTYDQNLRLIIRHKTGEEKPVK